MIAFVAHCLKNIVLFFCNDFLWSIVNKHQQCNFPGFCKIFFKNDLLIESQAEEDLRNLTPFVEKCHSLKLTIFSDMFEMNFDFPGENACLRRILSKYQSINRNVWCKILLKNRRFELCHFSFLVTGAKYSLFHHDVERRCS